MGADRRSSGIETVELVKKMIIIAKGGEGKGEGT